MRKVDMKEFLMNSHRYELRSGQEEGAPLCPYGNNYKWIGFDSMANEYVRFTTSVFKILVHRIENN